MTLETQPKSRRVWSCEMRGHQRTLSGVTLHTEGAEWLLPHLAVKFRVAEVSGCVLRTVRAEVVTATLSMPRTLSAAQLAALLQRWLMQQPGFMGGGVPIGRSSGGAAQHLEALGLPLYLMEDVLRAAIDLPRPYAQLGGVLLPLPWVRLAEAGPPWLTAQVPLVRHPSLFYRRFAVWYWTERLQAEPAARALLEAEPSEEVRGAVIQALAEYTGAQLDPAQLLQPALQPLPAGYLTLRFEQCALALNVALLPPGVVAAYQDRFMTWVWDDALYCQSGTHRYRQQPEELVNVLSRLMTGVGGLNPGPVGRQLMKALQPYWDV